MKPETTETEKDTQANAIAFALCAAVDGNWTAEGEHYWRTVTHASGYGVSLRWNDGRIHVSGIWPKTLDGAVITPRYGGESNPADISVSASKSPAQIAADIARRFLPDYRAAYQTAKDRAAAHDMHEATTQATIRTLRVANGQNAERARDNNGHPKDKIHLKHSHAYSLTVSGDSVRFESFSCPLSVALALLPLLRDDSKTY